MFSNRIANSAKFLQMPEGSQLLYFHMVLRADDDGVVESYPLIKLLGVAPDNFKVLQARGFIKELNEDQVVVIIDWLEHNSIRADRKVDSIYKHLLVEVAPDVPLITAKPRSDVEDNSRRVGGQSTDGISKVRLGKVSLSKDKLSEDNIHTETSSEGIPLLLKSFETINPACKSMYGNKTQRTACQSLIDSYGFERVKIVIEKTLPKTNTLQFFPVITTPVQLRDKWVALESAIRKYQSEKTTTNNKVAF